tara:strand:+ start:255 stop:530 length:276 start_codon:yes stop_codon:yes gene_type:complete
MGQPETDFGKKMQTFATNAIALVNEAADLDGMWGDGIDVALADGDVSDLNITAAEVTAGVTFCQQLGNLADNGTVTEGDYRKTLNDLRKIV